MQPRDGDKVFAGNAACYACGNEGRTCFRPTEGRAIKCTPCGEGK
jgi:hypothetical protein